MIATRPCETTATGLENTLAPDGASASSGYSLIETMVGLAVLALAVSVVIPGAVEMVSRYEAITERRIAEDSVNNCRIAAVSSGRAITLSEARSLQNSAEEAGACGVLPMGWSAEIHAPITFSPAAVCEGGAMSLSSPTSKARLYRLDPVRCRLNSG